MTPARTPARIPSSLNLTAMVSAAMSESASAAADAAAAIEPPPLPTPSVLTDEAQMRRLDAWTREAIDERLRVLEDVQRSLWKAAEDLQRVRSALPAATPSVPASSFFDHHVVDGVAAAPATTPASVPAPLLTGPVDDIKGKGKARAVEDLVPPPPTPTSPLAEREEDSRGVRDLSNESILVDPETGDVVQS